MYNYSLLLNIMMIAKLSNELSDGLESHPIDLIYEELIGYEINTPEVLTNEDITSKCIDSVTPGVIFDKILSTKYLNGDVVTDDEIIEIIINTANKIFKAREVIV